LTKRALALFAAVLISQQSALAQTPAGTAPAAPAAAPTNPYLVNIPSLSVPNPLAYLGLVGWLTSMKPSVATYDYQAAPEVSREQKAALIQAITPMLANFGIRDVMNFMTIKYKAKPDLTFDDVVESMKLRANQVNFKLVGHSPMWKDFQAVLGDMEAPRVEVFHYCDIAAGREVLKLSPEAVVYLPCRIAVLEDGKKNIWVMTLDWDMAWLNSVQGSLGINPTLSRYAIDIRDKMDQIMRAAANGDL
jgi:uncharacterized protein (DUF302 family)